MWVHLLPHKLLIQKFSHISAIVPLAQIIYSLWSPLLGQFSVDGVQAKNDHIHSRPGNFKYSGFRRSLAVSFPKLSFLRLDLEFVKKFTRPNFRVQKFYTLKTCKSRLFSPAINNKNASLSVIWPSFG